MKNTSLPFRGFHYDIARGSYLRPESFHEAIRHVARCGYTHFLPYLENMIRLPQMEKACPKVAYTPEDWRAFDQTATEVGIELVPHFNVIGHTEHICAVYPELAGPAGGRQLDVDRKETREWVLTCLRDLCSFSQGQYFLIGGDEWQAPNHLLERYPGQIGKLWAEHLNVAIQFLISQGRKPLVWHDMLMHYPEALDLLSRDAVIVFWYYDEDSDYPVLEMFKRYGFRTIMASGCHGHLNQRRSAAVQCAIRAAKKHQADGFLMTAWTSDVHWDAMRVTIKGVADLLAGGGMASHAPAVSAYSLWKRGNGTAAAALKQLDALKDEPDYQAYLRAELSGEVETVRELYTRYQYPCGPGYDAIGRSKGGGQAVRGTPAAVPKESFALEVTEDNKAGSALRFSNGGETFVIYPKYGASLQDWRIGDHTLITHALPAFLETNQFARGGYRSYTRALGFRPIWALGAHQNPHISWQNSFRWRRLDGPGIGVELTLSLPHCAIRYEVRIQEGRPGFVFAAEAVPVIGGLYGGWNFNFPLVIPNPERTRLRWGRKEMTVNAIEPGWLPDARTVDVLTAHWQLTVHPEIGETAGYFVDRGKPGITPDLHGRYRIRAAGEPVSARWRFSPRLVNGAE